MIKELEKNLSSFVQNQFILSGEYNFYNFYLKYKSKFTSRFSEKRCDKCYNYINGLGIGMMVEQENNIT